MYNHINNVNEDTNGNRVYGLTYSTLTFTYITLHDTLTLLSGHMSTEVHMEYVYTFPIFTLVYVCLSFSEMAGAASLSASKGNVEEHVARSNTCFYNYIKSLQKNVSPFVKIKSTPNNVV